MESFTKCMLSDDEIKSLFIKAGLASNIHSDPNKDDTSWQITPLLDGEFNSAWVVTVPQPSVSSTTATPSDSTNNENVVAQNSTPKSFVLKVSPPNGAVVLSYEKDLMKQELIFYELIRKNTSVPIPTIYFSDFSQQLIPANYFIMEKLNGTPLNKVTLFPNERDSIMETAGRMIAELHTIQNTFFGYEQLGTEFNWYEALKKNITIITKDCINLGHIPPCRRIILKFLDRCKPILETVPSVYTHFDIWEGNLFYEEIPSSVPCNPSVGIGCYADGRKYKLTLIDTERSFWGDPIGDFISLESWKPLELKKEFLRGYNTVSKNKIRLSTATTIRYTLLKIYLLLIMYTERFVRYNKKSKQYFHNGLYSRMEIYKLLFRLRGLQAKMPHK